ncbi:phosphatase PAP2 family protein [Pedobacter sp. SYSU D00535]|uniref:phosphatase PAP2 family protein n=1 Tax=Pedobacter sp. SYSU D00535 TaxID=2810308 RepID=UPI001A95B71A|nr:phosphatase PAP2 family protein [Pedobacter sp. SYSU D00535]
MLEQIVQLDHEYFLAINRGLANPFFDWLMPLLRNRFLWSPLYLFIVVFLVRNYKKTGWMCTLFLLVTFAISDFMSSSLIKPAVQRLRPCNEPGFYDDIITRVACGTGFSFPSTHATNHFAIAVFLIVIFQEKFKWVLPIGILWAFSIAFAQVYVGVHFPADVTIGALLGSMIGYIVATLFLNFQPATKWNSGN